MTEPEPKSAKSNEGSYPEVPAEDPRTILRPASGTGKDALKAKSLEESKTLILSSASAKLEAPQPVPAELEGSKTFVQSSGTAGPGKPAEKAASLAFQQISGIKLVKELGRGGMGIVYRGKQEFLDREVAVKMLLEQRKNPDFAARFKREAKILAGLQHPHIVTCYQADVTPDGTCFLVMEFVNGPNLREYLFEKGPLPVVDGLRICRDIAGALACAYEKKIIHRDVKSENVLLAPDPNAPLTSKFRYNVKLTDLGLARPETQEAGSSGLHLTMQASIVGTPQSMSPEQFDDPQGVDHRTDIYGLGCVLYDALITKPPFAERSLSGLLLAKRQAVRGPDPRATRPDIDPEAAELVMGMLAAAREDRPQTYAELIATCNALIAKLSPAESRKKGATSRRPLVAGLASICLLGGVGAWYALRDKPAPADTSKPTPPQPDKTERNSKLEPSPPTPPVISPSLLIQGPIETTENERVKLSATIQNPEGDASKFSWTKLKGPELAFDPAAAALEFKTPESASLYELEFKLEAQSGTKVLSKTHTLQVKATNATPEVKLSAPTTSLEGLKVDLAAVVHDVDSESALKYQWKQIAPAAPRVRFADEHASSTSFVAPLCITEEYELTLELATSDGDNVVAKEVKVGVTAAAERRPLTSKEPRRWMTKIVEFSNKLDGWEQGQTGLTLEEIPTGGGGFAATCAAGRGWITHPLPLGGYVLDLVLQPTARAESECGILLPYDEQTALVLCVLPYPDDSHKLVAYTAIKSPDGSWADPGPTTTRSTNFLFGSDQEMIELELTWDGKSLSLRSRDPSVETGTKDWMAAAAPFPLPSPPTSAALFVKRGKMSVTHIGIRGL